MNIRASLIEQLNSAKYPNLLLEVALHPAPPEVTAIRCGISESVLIDIMLGRDSITEGEAASLLEALRTDVGTPSASYAFSNVLACCIAEDVQSVREARREIKGIKIKHPALPLVKKLLKWEFPPDAALLALDAYRDFQKPEHDRRVQVTPRTLPLPEPVTLDLEFLDEWR